MLRAGRNPALDFEHFHSGIIHQIYADVTESQLLFTARLQRLTAWGALHSHPEADMGKASGQLKVHYLNALASIPYLTGGMDADGAVAQERQDAVDRYKTYKAAVLQGNVLRAPTPKPNLFKTLKKPT